MVFSSDFRRALQRVPLIRDLEQFVYQGFQSLSASTQQSIRLRLRGPARIDAPSLPRFHASDNIIAAQARKVAHSSGKAMSLLGYSALVSYAEGMVLTRDWLLFSRVIEGGRDR
jgi:hypothetical protein